MGYLFENAEKMDIQAERENTKEQRERAEAAEQRASLAEQRANASEHTLDLIIKDLIHRSRALGHTKEEVQKSLQSNYAMKEPDAKNKVEKYWN